MADWIAPAELDQPLPRKTKTNFGFTYVLLAPALTVALTALLVGRSPIRSFANGRS